jgi:uncharacterized protein YybS (DUF2232 family)
VTRDRVSAVVAGMMNCQLGGIIVRKFEIIVDNFDKADALRYSRQEAT